MGAIAILGLLCGAWTISWVPWTLPTEMQGCVLTTPQAS